MTLTEVLNEIAEQNAEKFGISKKKAKELIGVALLQAYIREDITEAIKVEITGEMW